MVRKLQGHYGEEWAKKAKIVVTMVDPTDWNYIALFATEADAVLFALEYIDG